MNDRQSSVGRKIRRKIRACIECRRRKIQCDLDRPFCGGCRKTGKQANCQYSDTLDTHASAGMGRGVAGQQAQHDK
jgi:hypothetical protein